MAIASNRARAISPTVWFRRKLGEREGDTIITNLCDAGNSEMCVYCGELLRMAMGNTPRDRSRTVDRGCRSQP